MEYTFRRTMSGRASLTLPSFADGTLRGEYYAALEKEILSYLGESPEKVRRYSAESTVSEKNGILTAEVTLSARLVTPSGVVVCRRRITDRWDGEKLVSHTVSDA